MENRKLYNVNKCNIHVDILWNEMSDYTWIGYLHSSYSLTLLHCWPGISPIRDYSFEWLGVKGYFDSRENNRNSYIT